MLFGATDFIDATQATSFVGLGGDANPAPSAAAGGDAVVPVAGTLYDLNVVAVPNATSKTVVITVEKNDAATTLACTITAVAPAGTARTCSDSTHSIAFAAGNKLAVLVSNGTGSFVKYVRWTAEYR